MSSSSVSSSSSSTATTSSLGLGSGIDINSIIDGLMEIEAQQQTRLKNQVTNKKSLISVYQDLNTKVKSMQTAAEDLYLPSSWKVKKASSTSSNVTASATTAAISGSLSFVVKKLATAETVASSATVSSTDTVVTSGSFLLGKGGGAIGIGNVSGTGLTDGSHTIEVTQASSGATQSGSSSLAGSTTFTGSETITANVGGVSKTYTMTAGTYNKSELTAMISKASGGDLNASTNADGSLKLTTADEGSASSLQITGGSALSSLNMSAGSTSNGTDGILTVDGVENTVTDIRHDGSNSVVLNGTDGSTITASFSGGLRAGSADYESIDMGDGKLSTVISKINSANAGVTASAVQVSAGQYRLQLQSTDTGSAGKISADLSDFSAVLGSFDTVTEAQDAELQVGTGSGAYTITSSSNSVTDVLPGVTMNLVQADPDTTVTVNVAGDGDSLATKVKAMVDAANEALSYIKDNSNYDSDSGESGYLLGNSTASRLQQNIFSAMNAQLGSTTSMADIGITTNDDGTFEFDSSKFTTKYQSDPEAVASMFVEGGTSGNSTGDNLGLAQRIQKLGYNSTNSVDGSITIAIKGENTTIDDLNDQIDNWDTRLAQRRETMVKQYTAMDTAVAELNSQSSWLTSATNSLLTSYS